MHKFIAQTGFVVEELKVKKSKMQRQNWRERWVHNLCQETEYAENEPSKETTMKLTLLVLVAKGLGKHVMCCKSNDLSWVHWIQVSKQVSSYSQDNPLP